MRDNSNQEGIMSLGYLKDGTQQRIIAALEDALFQAKSQLLLSHDVNRIADICTMTWWKRKYNIPVA
ncbi:Rrf2 family transcriptional regulator [Salmonella enterica]|nr:Rrf2 family transcriptional regulator [Salmonella enterica]EAA9597687.1 Rrf2 family transcriptional regulator [Salmonella enterica]EAO9640115.1 Rrf2 family transcriptional regulator [Salmonella enterica]EKI3326420.1 Rrf2 family transcriptional regulator [Salmonella enterica]